MPKAKDASKYNFSSKRGQSRLEQVLSHLTERGHTTAPILAKVLGLSESGARNYLYKLLESGTVERASLHPDFTCAEECREGEYHYFLPDRKPTPKEQAPKSKPRPSVTPWRSNMSPKEKRQRYIAEWEARKLAQRGQYSKAAARTYHDRVQP